MELRRGLMMAMAIACAQEIFTIDDDSLTNTIYIDDYFRSRIQGWDTEPIILIYKPVLTKTSRKLTYVYSSYLATKYSVFTTIYRSNTNGSWDSANRSNYAITVNVGDEYLVIRGVIPE